MSHMLREQRYWCRRRDRRIAPVRNLQRASRIDLAADAHLQ